MASISATAGAAWATAATPCFLLLKYFFTELRYRKCTVGIYEFNEASIAFHESLGFKLEGRLRDMVFTNRRFYDELHYGMTADEFWERYGENISF